MVMVDDDWFQSLVYECLSAASYLCEVNQVMKILPLFLLDVYAHEEGWISYAGVPSW